MTGLSDLTPELKGVRFLIPVRSTRFPMNRRIQTLVWAVLFLMVVIVVAWGLKNNPEWQAFSWRGFLNQLLRVRRGYVLVGLAISLFCYVIRTLRWREFLFPVKHASFENLFSAVVIGFAAVSLLGRAGELSRPFILSRKENLPLSISLTAVLMERLFDFGVILTLFLGNLFFFTGNSVVSMKSMTLFHLFSRGATLVLAVLVSITLFLFLFQKNALRWLDFLIDRTWLIPTRFKFRMERMLKSIVDGLAFIVHPRALTFSLFYSFLLWLLAAAGNYFIVRAFGVEFSFSMAIVMLTFAAIGAIIQLPGVGGGFQALTLFALVTFLGVNPTTASGITLAAWVIAFFPVVGIGLVFLFKGGWSLRSLRNEAEREVEAALTEDSALVETSQSQK